MPPPPPPRHPAADTPRRPLRDALSVFRYGGRALRLVWQTHRGLTILIASLTLVAGLMPAAVAWVGKLIVDGVVEADRAKALQWLAVEGGLVVLLAAVRRAQSVADQLLRAQLAQRVNVVILEKALTLDLADFEDPALYDTLTRARRQASSRPLSLVRRTFGLAQNAVSIAGFSGLLWSFSPLAVLLLAAASVPAFLSEARFAAGAFRLFSWRTPETREQTYIETLLAREDNVKEVQLFGLGPRMLAKYEEIFVRLYAEDRALTLRRGVWGFLLGLLGTAAFYGTYAWVALAAVAGAIGLGAMTMYLMVFKQGQTAFAALLEAIGGMYEDNLYLTDLYTFLDRPARNLAGVAVVGPKPGDGIRFEGVSFAYPGAEHPALRDLSLHIQPGQKLALVGENGSGKTTFIKLLTRLYRPTAGRILLDGLDLAQWDEVTLRRRMGVIFQDFVRYQFGVGENIGAGDEARFEDRAGWSDAAHKALASDFIEALPKGYETRLGRWFDDGRELSGGQWQKIALARAFMRTRSAVEDAAPGAEVRGADIVVLDEPTSAIDAEAEAAIFARFRTATRDQMAILISHRFSTVRQADAIAVLHGGALIEQGSHESLMALGGRYAHLFNLQARAYVEDPRADLTPAAKAKGDAVNSDLKSAS